MTIAVAVKVHEGLVLATDSASTLMGHTPMGAGVVNVYDNANKIVNLVKGMPVGVMTWGAGAIGTVSMTTIFKDLREVLTGTELGPNGEDWTVQTGALSIAAVADKLRRYVFEELYVTQFGAGPDFPDLGMIVAGYSSGVGHAEEYQIDVNGRGECSGPTLLRPAAECGFTVGGQPETISRLILGVDPRMAQVLEQGLGVDPSQSEAAAAVIQQHLQAPVVADAMPFKDAVDLAHFLVDTTIKMTRFLPGPATVGGPIEIAGITKHEGFKWVSRKHYFNTDLNPKG
jgi:hypothetical protein